MGNVSISAENQQKLDKFSSSYPRYRHIKEAAFMADFMANNKWMGNSPFQFIDFVQGKVQIYDVIQTLRWDNKYKSFTKAFAQFTVSIDAATQVLSTKLKQSQQLDTIQFQERAQLCYMFSERMKQCTERALNKFAGIKAQFDIQVATPPYIQFQSLLQQYNEKVDFINYCCEEREKEFVSIKQRAKTEFAKLNSTQIDAYVDSVVEHKAQLIEMFEEQLQEYKKESMQLAEDCFVLSVFSGLDETYKYWDNIQRNVSLQMAVLRDKAFACNLVAHDRQNSDDDPEVKAILVEINVQECKSKLVPELLKTIEDGIKSNAEYLKEMNRIKDVPAKEWSTTEDNGLIYLN